MTGGGAAEAAGLKAGDVLLLVEGKPVKSPADFFTIFDGALADATKKDVWASHMRGTENAMIYIDLPKL